MNTKHGKFIITEYSLEEKDIKIQARINQAGETKWVVVKPGSFVLSKEDLRFEYEPFSSHRTEEFIQRTRFDSVEEAIKFFEAYMDQPSMVC